MSKRITFHSIKLPGPKVQALIDQHAGSAVVIQHQNWIRRIRIGVPHENAAGWGFERLKLTETLLSLKETFDDE